MPGDDHFLKSTMLGGYSSTLADEIDGISSGQDETLTGKEALPSEQEA